ncbi:hypothetical protein QFC20_000883 [Naganishia adeliensis]|uniref:Uncharacterized protein n=1 Tax=Naganishia adeliensis TaxID=92952 RepID=A0ACC2WXG2_9TREE|nr:hypothetical protein QFC20_000883 [Naganishia adeliensis]
MMETTDNLPTSMSELFRFFTQSPNDPAKQHQLSVNDGAPAVSPRAPVISPVTPAMQAIATGSTQVNHINYPAQALQPITDDLSALLSNETDPRKGLITLLHNKLMEMDVPNLMHMVAGVAKGGVMGILSAISPTYPSISGLNTSALRSFTTSESSNVGIDPIYVRRNGPQVHLSTTTTHPATLTLSEQPLETIPVASCSNAENGDTAPSDNDSDSDDDFRFDDSVWAEPPSSNIESSAQRNRESSALQGETAPVTQNTNIPVSGPLSNIVFNNVVCNIDHPDVMHGILPPGHAALKQVPKVVSRERSQRSVLPEIDYTQVHTQMYQPAFGVYQPFLDFGRKPLDRTTIVEAHFKYARKLRLTYQISNPDHPHKDKKNKFLWIPFDEMDDKHSNADDELTVYWGEKVIVQETTQSRIKKHLQKHGVTSKVNNALYRRLPAADRLVIRHLLDFDCAHLYVPDMNLWEATAAMTRHLAGRA